jgi:hypothetical protein
MAVGKDATAIKIGPGILRVALLGTTEPTSLTGTPAAGWVEVGYTLEGSTFSFEQNVEDVEVEEEFYPVLRVAQSKSATVAFTVAQDTAQNLAYLLNNPDPTLTSGAYEVEPVTPGNEVERMLLWDDGVADDGTADPETNTRRYLWRRVTQTGGGEIQHRKGSNVTGVALEFTSLKPAGTAQPYKAWYAAALSGVA